MTTKKAIRLLHKYLYGKPAVQEKIQIDRWYNSVKEKDITNQEELTQIKERLYHKTWLAINVNTSGIIVSIKKQIFRISAAAVFIGFIAGGYFLFSSKEKKQTIISKKSHQQQNIDIAPPTTNKATLTLSDGTVISLDDVAKGTFAVQGNTKVTKKADGTISYNPEHNNQGIAQYNTIAVPKGSKPIQLLLSDGSEVWLNVASSLTYPTFFTGKHRKVEITGEAYFEVAHNSKMPFKVIKNDVEIEVLGTHFNVNAYSNENTMKVTLVEGSVKVSQLQRNSLIIKPNQQALINASSLLLNKEVNIDEALAWKNGYFQFYSADAETIFKQAERWYNVEFDYPSKLEEKFSGQISKSVNLSQLLKILESTGKMKFIIDGRIIHVKS